MELAGTIKEMLGGGEDEYESSDDEVNQNGDSDSGEELGTKNLAGENILALKLRKRKERKLKESRRCGTRCKECTKGCLSAKMTRYFISLQMF